MVAGRHDPPPPRFPSKSVRKMTRGDLYPSCTECGREFGGAMSVKDMRIEWQAATIAVLAAGIRGTDTYQCDSVGGDSCVCCGHTPSILHHIHCEWKAALDALEAWDAE